MAIILLCCHTHCLFFGTGLYSIQSRAVATADQGFGVERHFSVDGGVKGNMIWGVGISGCFENTK